MAELKGSKTHENLRAAFVQEAQARMRCLYFAVTAEIEGYAEIAKLFNSLAELEVHHIDGQLDMLRRLGDPVTGLPIGDTEHNLASLVAGAEADATDLYPTMARTALNEGFPDIADWFLTLAKAKRSHCEDLEKSRTEVKRWSK